jgi:hypothetical protein
VGRACRASQEVEEVTAWDVLALVVDKKVESTVVEEVEEPFGMTSKTSTAAPAVRGWPPAKRTRPPAAAPARESRS